MSEGDRSGAGGALPVLVARIGSRRIALAVRDVAGVAPLAPLWRPPTLPRAIAGFLNHRGRALPVLDATRLFDTDGGGRPDLYAHILILPGVGQGGAGLLVDRVETMATWEQAALLPIEGGETLNGCAIALADIDGAPVHLLAAERLLAAGEAAVLDGLRETAAARLSDWGVPS